MLAVGGEPGARTSVSPWEYNFAAMPLLRAERWDEAIDVLEAGLREHPGNAVDPLQPRLRRVAGRAAPGGARAPPGGDRARPSTPTGAGRPRLRADPRRAGLPGLVAAGEADTRGELAERRHRVGLRPGDEQHRAEAVVGRERVDEELQPDRERERLVRLLAAEGPRSSSRARPASTSP